MSEINPIEIVNTPDGKKHKVAFKMNVKGKNFVITLDRIVLLENEMGSFEICDTNDEDAKIFYEYLQPTKSLDIDNGDFSK